MSKEKSANDIKTYSIHVLTAQKIDEAVEEVEKEIGVNIPSSDLLFGIFEALREQKGLEVWDKIYAYSVFSKVLRKLLKNLATENITEKEKHEIEKKMRLSLRARSLLVEIFKYADSIIDSGDYDYIKETTKTLLDLLEKNKECFFDDFEKATVYVLTNAYGKHYKFRRPTNIDRVLKLMRKILNDNVKKVERRKETKTDIDVLERLKEVAPELYEMMIEKSNKQTNQQQ